MVILETNEVHTRKLLGLVFIIHFATFMCQNFAYLYVILLSVKILTGSEIAISHGPPEVLPL